VAVALVDCSECGKSVSDKAPQCIHCGCPMVAKIDCPECGASIDADSTSCQHCGYPIAAEKAAAAEPRAQSAVDRTAALDEKTTTTEVKYLTNHSKAISWMAIALGFVASLLNGGHSFNESMYSVGNEDQAFGAFLGGFLGPAIFTALFLIGRRFRNFSSIATMYFAISISFFLVRVLTSSIQ